MIIDIMFSRWW